MSQCPPRLKIDLARKVGLGIPGELMGLSFGAYGGDVPVVDLPKGMDEKMLRRYLIELGGHRGGCSAREAGCAAGSPRRGG